MEDADVTTRTRRRHQQRGGDKAPAATGNGEARDKPVLPAPGRAPRHRITFLGLTVLFITIVAVGAAAGSYGSLLLPNKYAARAELQYSLSQAIPNELLREDRTLTTQRILLRSRRVIEPVASENGMTPEDLAENVSVEVVENSEIIEVEVRDRTRERAEALLNGIVSRYLDLANANWEEPVESYLRWQLEEVRKQLRAPGVLPEVTTALVQREQAVIGLLDTLPPADPNSPGPPSGPPAGVLVDPYPVAAQVSPTPLFAGAAGGTTGFVIAALVVLLIVRRRLQS
jgi:hypothetical protein